MASTEPSPALSGPTDPPAVSVVRSALKAFLDGDFDALRLTLASDVLLEIVPATGSYGLAELLMAMLQRLHRLVQVDPDTINIAAESARGVLVTLTARVGEKTSKVKLDFAVEIDDEGPDKGIYAIVVTIGNHELATAATDALT